MNQSDIVEAFVSAFLKESKSFLKELHDEGKVFLTTGIKEYLKECYSKYYSIKTILNGNTPVNFPEFKS